MAPIMALIVAAANTASLLSHMGTYGKEHFDMLLHVEAPHSQADTYMDTTPPIGGVNPRPVVEVKMGEQIEVRWRMKSVFPHGVMKNVTIRFFVVREEKLGQKAVPELSAKSCVLINAYTMDFAPSAQTVGMAKFTLPEAGNYLVRIQSENTKGEEHDHEHFSAVDVHAK